MQCVEEEGWFRCQDKAEPALGGEESRHSLLIGARMNSSCRYYLWGLDVTSSSTAWDDDAMNLYEC